MAKMNNSGRNPTSPLMPPLACASNAAGWLTTFTGFQTYKAFYLPSESSARTSLRGRASQLRFLLSCYRGKVPCGLLLLPRRRKRPRLSQHSGEFPKPYSMTYPPHSVKVMGQVVDGVEQPREPFAGGEQVPQIRPRIFRADPAFALG